MKIKTYDSIYSDFLEVIKKENSQRQRQINPNDFLEELDFISKDYLKFYSYIYMVKDNNFILHYNSNKFPSSGNYINIFDAQNSKNEISFTYHTDVLLLGGFCRYSIKHDEFIFSSIHSVVRNENDDTKFQTLYYLLSQHIEEDTLKFFKDNTNLFFKISENIYNLNMLLNPIYKDDLYWDHLFSNNKKYSSKEIITTLEAAKDFMALNSDQTFDEEIKIYRKTQESFVDKVKRIILK